MKKILRSPVITGLLFLLAAVLLFAGTVGGTQAALSVKSKNYYSAFNLEHIGVTLYENGKAIAYRNYGSKAASGFTEKQDGNLVLNNLGDDKEVKIGKQYPCAITTQNTGTIDQYVRVTIRKYWVKDVSDPGGKGWFKFNKNTQTKITDDIFDPDYIVLSYKGDEYNTANWYRDDIAPFSKECDVYYYKGVVSPKGTTAPLFDSLSISNEISKYKMANVSTDGNTTIYTYAFDGYGFVIEAEVDAVQTHHAWTAMTSAWGTSADIMTGIGISKDE